MSITFPEIKERLGFGFMRLPMKEGEVDVAETCRMVDAFLAAGFHYFDTAHGYIKGKSEVAIRTCLAERHPRESFLLANKLTAPFFEREEDIRPFLESQLKTCGVDYFDFYLMHAQDRVVFEKFKACRAYETAIALREEGLLRHVGLSFHDKPEVLDRILCEYPQVEFVQIQFNYIDYEDASIQARACYEVCRKHGKPVMIMEPVKGGSLVNLPAAAADVLRALDGGSPASYALRFAAGFEGVEMVLSGMGSMQMIEDNTSVMRDFQPLDARERAAVERVCEILRAQNLIACTGCEYCVAGCPAGIKIPQLFSCHNGRELLGSWNAGYYYSVHTKEGGKASDCVACGACEAVCPQHLPIRELLLDVATSFEKK